MSRCSNFKSIYRIERKKQAFHSLPFLLPSSACYRCSVSMIISSVVGMIYALLDFIASIGLTAGHSWPRGWLHRLDIQARADSRQNSHDLMPGHQIGYHTRHGTGARITQKAAPGVAKKAFKIETRGRTSIESATMQGVGAAVLACWLAADDDHKRERQAIAMII